MQKTTMIFSLIIFVLIAVYDVFAIYKGGTEASISYLIIVWSYEYPVFTFATGFLMGHLFWRVRNVGKLSDKQGDEK